MNKSKQSTSRNTKLSGNFNGGKSQDSLMKSKYSSLGLAQTSLQYGTKIAQLQEKGDQYVNKIETECKNLIEVEQEITKAEALLAEKRRDIMNKKREAGKDKNLKAMKSKIESMHHHLDLLRKEKNEIFAQNQDLKDGINDLRKEKNIYDKILIDLQIQLEEKKGELQKVLLQSERAKDEIKNGYVQLDKLKQDSVVNKDYFEEQLKIKFQVFDAEGKDAGLQQRFSINFQDLQRKDQTNYNQYPTNNFITQPENQGYPMSPEQKKRKQEEKEIEQKERQQRQFEELRRQVNKYKDTFNDLKQETNQDNMEGIVKHVQNYEEENYSLFRYINKLREEYDSLKKQIKQLQGEIDQQKLIPKNIKNDKQMKKYIQIRADIEETKKKKQQHEDKHQSLKKLIDELKVHLPVMFDKIKCRSSGYIEEIQKNFDIDDLDESNMVQFLAVIERRTNDLLQLYQEVQQQKEGSIAQKNKKIDVRNPENLQHALKKMDEDILDINMKLKEAQKYNEVPIKEKDKNFHGHDQLEDTAKIEINKIVTGAEKQTKGKKKRQQQILQ